MGGALIPLLYGKLADGIGYQHAFVVPALCYVYVAVYGFAASRRRLMTDPLAGAEAENF